MAIARMYVKKKDAFTQESSTLCRIFKEELHIPVEKVTLYDRYDIEGLTPEELEMVRPLFVEAPVEDVYETIEEKNAYILGKEFLPGQYDQRADSAMQCASLLTKKSDILVSCAQFLAIEGAIEDGQKEQIKKYYINPVDSHEASLSLPTTLKQEMPNPSAIPSYTGFTQYSESELEDFLNTLGLAMTLADLKTVQIYYREEEHRDPTETEIKVLDTYWSDHCRHTTFMTELTDIAIEDSLYTMPIKVSLKRYEDNRKLLYIEKKKAITLMDMATIAAKELRKAGSLEALDISDEINACTINVKVNIDGKEEDWLLLFKNETHNHPTEIEPFGGAATCLGGCIRDPLSGRAYVYQAMRVTGSGDPRQAIEDTLPGKLPQRVITTGAAKGYSSYGNQIGLATGEVKEYYHPGFIAKRMEIGALVGAVPKSSVRREAPVENDVIILIGGDTGRDGCGGATGSSKEHTTKSIETCGTEVQKGNALTERKIQRLFRRPEVTSLIKKCNDFGAGGVSVAIGELADSLQIELDKVPKKYEGLSGTELAISESQERMACVLDQKDVESFIRYCQEENVKATKVALVTNTGRLIMTWRGQEIVNISRDFLNTNGAKQERKARILPPEGHFFVSRQSNEIKKTWLSLMASLDVASQQGLCETFDASIGANTVLMPFGGKYQKTPVQGMVSKIPVLDGETNTVSIMTHGFDPHIASWSPYHGAQFAILSAVAKIIALGGSRKNIYLSLQEYFEKLGKNDISWGKAVSALLGAYEAQKELAIAAIGGKDSMSGTFHDLKVPPSLVAFAVTTSTIEKVISPELKHVGSKLLLFHTPRYNDDTPNWKVFKEHCLRIEEAIDYGVVTSISPLGMGGIAEGISKMALGNNIGVQLEQRIIPHLFDVAHGSFIMEVDADIAETLEQYEYITTIGETTQKPMITIGTHEITLKEITKAYEEPLQDIFPLKSKSGLGEAVVYIHDYHSKPRSTVLGGKPKVLIPLFPGTNCEYDTIKAFKKAGAETDLIIIRNQSLADLEESAMLIEKKLKESQILMLPGGFSAGDEPAGSGKYIAAFFRNPRLTEALHNLLYKQDGLALGICNGFQALIKLGLLPGGYVTELTANSPTLTYNTIGRHISRFVSTKVISVKSPWMNLIEAGEIYKVAISHGEGRFMASPSQIVEFNKKGQIATQYVDIDGIATYNADYNPNQSVSAIEGIFSPDGRVFGKMGHSERVGYGLCKNIPEFKEMPIFASGVSYFK